MVLHGSTGVVDDDIRGAIRRGVRKINIGTGLKVSFTAGIKEALMDEGLEDPMHYLTKGIERVRRFVAAKMQLLGSAGKA
jgi:tagatose 1,6-diphosphate aldolase GatY/KbaY